MVKSRIISCCTIKPEIDEAIQETKCEYPVLYLESALHDQPEALKTAIQKELDCTSNVEQVILAMGYCGNAIMGLRAHEFRIVVPRVEDCITLFLGSQKKRKEIMDESATYFFTKGWLDAERNILDEHERVTQKYGNQKADLIFNIMFKHYERLGLIDTGVFELEPQICKIDRISRILKIKFGIIPGTMRLLKKLLTGPYDDNFIIVEHGRAISYDDIFCGEMALGTSCPKIRVQ